MSRSKWIGFIAARYVSRGRRNSPSPVLSVLGIATGVLALTVIIAVMNGFQLGFIESILEISSGHLRIENLPPEKADDALYASLRRLPGVDSVLPFREINVLLRGRLTNPRGALVRGVPPDALELDSGLAGKLEMESGSFDLADPRNIVLGAELAALLSARAGDEISLLSITGGLLNEEGGLYRVTGIFRSGFYEYDMSWAFVNIDTAAVLSDNTAPPVIGIKLKNRWNDTRETGEIEKAVTVSGITEADGFSVVSWREYNSSFFGALRTEKLMMFILVGLIFIVVGLNIFQAQRRTVLERREEIGLLRALGARDTAVRLVFVWDGFIIGFTGALLGLGLGLLIAFNITPFFSFLETVVNFFISVVNNIVRLFGGNAGAEEFSVFSPQIFYIKEIPSRIIPEEAALIFLFGFLSAVSAAWFASGKVSGTKPAEVLRYE